MKQTFICLMLIFSFSAIAQSVQFVRVDNASLKEFQLGSEGSCGRESCRRLDEEYYCNTPVLKKAEIILVLAQSQVVLEVTPACAGGQASINSDLQKLQSIVLGDVMVNERGSCKKQILDVALDSKRTGIAHSWAWKWLATSCP